MAWMVRRDPDAIAAAFTALLADPVEAARRAAVAQQLAAAWDEAAMLRRTEALLRLEALRWG
jgi:hypothetical protein